MLPIYLRVLLLVGALASLLVVANKVKKYKILVEDAVFWIVLDFIFVILAIFPGIAVSLAYVLGFVSPANFVYLVIITLLLWKVFVNSTEISRLKDKVNELAQEIALAHKDDQD